MTTKYRIIEVFNHDHGTFDPIYHIEKLVNKPVRNWWGKKIGTVEQWKYVDWWYSIACCETAIETGVYGGKPKTRVVKEITR